METVTENAVFTLIEMTWFDKFSGTCYYRRLRSDRSVESCETPCNANTTSWKKTAQMVPEYTAEKFHYQLTSMRFVPVI
jgi:hypothetical protein